MAATRGPCACLCNALHAAVVEFSFLWRLFTSCQTQQRIWQASETVSQLSLSLSRARGTRPKIAKSQPCSSILAEPYANMIAMAGYCFILCVERTLFRHENVGGLACDLLAGSARELWACAFSFTGTAMAGTITASNWRVSHRRLLTSTLPLPLRW